MFKNEAKELLPIIQAFAEGKEVEFSFNGIDNWVGIGNNPSWEYHTDQYRIKPEPKLVPFTFEDNKIFRDKYVRYKGCFPLSKIISFGPKGIYFGNAATSYEYLFKENEFEDGTPCGKYVNE